MLCWVTLQSVLGDQQRALSRGVSGESTFTENVSCFCVEIKFKDRKTGGRRTNQKSVTCEKWSLSKGYEKSKERSWIKKRIKWSKSAVSKTVVIWPLAVPEENMRISNCSFSLIISYIFFWCCVCLKCTKFIRKAAILNSKSNDTSTNSLEQVLV